MLNPNLTNVRQNPMARLLPLARLQVQAYRHGEILPPGLCGYGPKWECITVTVGGRGTQQMRVSLENDFHLVALAASSANAGGFRAQLYDMNKRLRFADRGVNVANIAGGLSGTSTDPVILREPYRFDEPGAQVLAVIQNQDANQNNIQLVLFGMCLRVDQEPPE
jgi:hypothetical protein